MMVMMMTVTKMMIMVMMIGDLPSSTEHTDMFLWSCVWCKDDDGGI